ncbi:flavin monoamine oxidase family protein [Mycolicibacterium arseniciresistens]|jgi:monoamine oxidase|uniref:FAD-dependent oxidoreductase n=1 Tax=Mycolicibacterium arseniciresistens TaxID=3062257 RepID=A0ABT8UK47_9MYCO|nr:FAD-dependent oxidoreductase [Mycolicibacterium arseniciresistens]MDO3636748.1 FAD-dependent oxidoreductase [Mycolicibacterium arseniciresistens]
MPDVDVCVVGAGFAGLTAALRLTQAGHSVAVLEARDRIGGRTLTEQRDDGSYLDHGGTWVGPGQDRVYALMNEFGVPAFKQFVDGEAMMVVDGRQYRYSGTIPWSMNPLVSVNLGAAFLELRRMCRAVPVHAPWAAPKADKWDRTTLAQWLDRTVPMRQARQLLGMALAGTYTSAPSEISMLFVVAQLASAGGPDFVLGVQNGAEDARPVGGMGAVYRAVAAAVAGDIHLEQPVRSIRQDADGVTVRSDGSSVRTKRVIVAVPLAIASHIDYEPMLPTDRSFLHQRMPTGAVLKTHVIYDEPFWRDDGLTGQSAAPGTAASVTLDACTHEGRPGVLCVVAEGPHARQLSRMSGADRRSAVLEALTARFGRKAGAPVDYTEQNWTVERYSGGGMISHAPPGVLTEFGHALREPCGRIHWAGTESADVMMGFVDGAVRSGERAAREAIAGLSGTLPAAPPLAMA